MTDVANEAAVHELESLREYIRETVHSQYKKDFIEIGDFSYGVPKLCFWDDKTHLSIGKFCSIAENVTIMLGGEHRTDWVSTYPFNAFVESYSYIQGHPATKGNIVIGNDVWIASGAKIMSGVTIGDGAVIGANTLVSKDVPDYYIAVGAGGGYRMRPRFDSDTIGRLCELKWWDWELEDIANVIPLLQSGNVDGLLDFYQGEDLKRGEKANGAGKGLRRMFSRFFSGHRSKFSLFP